MISELRMTSGAALMTVCLGTSILFGCAATRTSDGAATADAPPAADESFAAAPDAVSPDQQSMGWNTTPLAVASEPVAVKEGGVPLVYLVESPGVFRVHDRTAGQDLARANAVARSIVSVDGRRGVVFGGETLVPGPLEADHRYVIYRDPTGPNMARQGVFQPRPGRATGSGQGSEQAR